MTTRRQLLHFLPLALVLLVACAAELDNPTSYVDQTGNGGGSGGTPGGSGGTPGGSGGTPGGAGTGGMPGGAGSTAVCDAPTMIFAVPGDQGGCDGDVCHRNGSPFPPNLSDPVVGLRDVDALLCPGYKYIDVANPANSLILNKVTQPMPVCAERMPYMLPALDATKTACLTEWVNSVAAGP